MSKGMLLFCFFMRQFMCILCFVCVFYDNFFCLKYVKLHSRGYNAWEAWDAF